MLSAARGGVQQSQAGGGHSVAALTAHSAQGVAHGDTHATWEVATHVVGLPAAASVQLELAPRQGPGTGQDVVAAGQGGRPQGTAARFAAGAAQYRSPQHSPVQHSLVS